MTGQNANEVYLYALKLLRGRDYTAAKLREKLETHFGAGPQEIIDELIRRKFLDDRRYAENYISKRKHRGAPVLREELAVRGVPAALVDETLAHTEWPSLKTVLTAKMNAWKMLVPLTPRDAARLFRALQRLGYDEDAIREEIEQIHEQ